MKLPKSLVSSPLAALASLLVISSGFAAAQVPQVINYQGRISSGGAAFTGNGQFKFALVSNDGTTTFWSNDGTSTAGSEPTGSVSLPAAAGLYVAPLGDTAIAAMAPLPPTVFSNNGVNLRVWFNDGTNGSQQLTPDQRVLSVAYAMMAAGVQNGAITSAMIAPGAVTPDKLASSFSIPAGTIVAFAGTTAPAGWQLCNGLSLNGALPENAALFSTIGLTYGGSGNTFQVPDMRGRTAVGAGQGAFLTNRLLAATFGAETHTLTSAEMPSHTHTGRTNTDGAHGHTTSGNAADDDGGGADTHFALGDSNAGRAWIGIGIGGGAHFHDFTTNATGQNVPHNNMQPSIVLNYIIKL